MQTDDSSERLYPIYEAVKKLGGTVRAATVRRLCTRGVRGTKLNSLLLSARRVCTLEDVESLLMREHAHDQAQPYTEPLTKRQQQKVLAAQELEKLLRE